METEDLMYVWNVYFTCSRSVRKSKKHGNLDPTIMKRCVNHWLWDNLKTALPLSGNDNSIQLHLYCLLCHCICKSDNYLYVCLTLNINLIKTKDCNIKGYISLRHCLNMTYVHFKTSVCNLKSVIMLYSSSSFCDIETNPGSSVEKSLDIFHFDIQSIRNKIDCLMY